MLPPPECIEFANESLKRWPNDNRLMQVKRAILMNAGNPVAAALFTSELIRRHGLSTALAEDLQEDIYALYQFDFPNTSATAHALRKGLEDYLRLRPRAWPMRRLYGLHLWNMAYFDPVSVAEDVSNTETIRLAQTRTYELALDQLTQASTGHTAPLVLLKDIMRLKIDMGAPPESLMPILARMQLLHPDNIDGDLMVAAHMGKRAPAGDMAYLDIIKKAVERVGTSPQVMDKVTYAMAGPLSMTIQPHNSDNYMRLKDRPDALYYGEAMEVALSDGRLVDPIQMKNFFYVIKANNGWVPKWKIYNEYLDRNLKKLKEALDAGRWQEGLKISAAIGHLGGDNSKMFVDYARVKCLWKLKRYREALYYCEEFQNYHPDKHTFYYMFAVVAEEAGVRLEEAYEKAKIAIPLDPTNQGIKDVLARLGQRLGKPTTL
jgi:tetratricopeptide (TPR) repeat protein